MTYCKQAWLIDDDVISNHLTAKTLELNGFCSEIRLFTNAREALSELEASLEEGTGFPDYIFLDLNMPILDGWEFLKAYRKFPEEEKSKCTLYILSSSVDEQDINKSKLYEDVRDFFSKPLHKIHLQVIKFQKSVGKAFLL